MILIDYSPVLISCAHSAVAWEKQVKAAEAKGKKLEWNDPNVTIGDVHFFRMMNTLRMVNKNYRRNFGETVICVDRKPYWRNIKFKEYKKNRKPMDRSMDWRLFFDNGEDILNACKDVFGWKVIDVTGVEGDDIIGVLVHDNPNENHMVVSPDGDFKQLQIYKNVQQYDTIRKRKIIEKEPELWLKEKIITGDKKDGIPNIVSPVDTFVTEGARQNPIKRRDKEAWIAASSPMFFCDQEMLERYRQNEEWLDMSKVPDEYKEKIIEAFNVPAKRQGNLYGYFAERGLTRFIDQMDDFK